MFHEFRCALYSYRSIGFPGPDPCINFLELLPEPCATLIRHWQTTCCPKVVAGMLASIGDDYFVTDRSWKCSATYYDNWMLPGYNDSSWPDAVIVLPNAPSNPHHGRRPEISSGASWIWTANFRTSIDTPVYCRGRLRM